MPIIFSWVWSFQILSLFQATFQLIENSSQSRLVQFSPLIMPGFVHMYYHSRLFITSLRIRFILIQLCIYIS